LSSWTEAGSMYACGEEKAAHNTRRQHEKKRGRKRKAYLCVLRMRGGRTASATATRVGSGGAGSVHARAWLRRDRHGLPLAGAGAGAGTGASALPALLCSQSLLLALTRATLLPPRPLRLGTRTHVRTLPAPLDDLGFVLCLPCVLFCG
jgi:hypothetical protein